MPTFVRVRLENGSEASVSPAFAALHKLKPLDKPAARGRVALPAKHNPLKKPALASADADTTPEEKK